jgi:anti-sigma factor (TIGR02949 family)
VTSAAALRCAGIHRFIDTYLDGEFGERERGEFEAHLAECHACMAKVKEQRAWKQAVRAASPQEKAPAALRNRVMRGMARASRPRRNVLWRVLPLAAVAGVVGTLAVARLNWTPVALDVVAKHRRNLPIEIAGPADTVRHWYGDKLDFPVRPPRLVGASLRGGRLANLGEHSAAYLVYDANGNRVSVFVFEPSDVRMETTHKVVINNRDVYIDTERGYNVALYRENGLGYAVTSDVPEDQMVKLVSGAFQVQH